MKDAALNCERQRKVKEIKDPIDFVYGLLPHGSDRHDNNRQYNPPTSDEELEYFEMNRDDYYDDPEDIITYPDEIFDFNED